MKLILDGLNASGGTRASLLGWLPTVQNRQSVLGAYGFDANGDTTLRPYGVYGVVGKGTSSTRGDHRRLSSSQAVALEHRRPSRRRGAGARTRRAGARRRTGRRRG